MTDGPPPGRASIFPSIPIERPIDLRKRDPRAGAYMFQEEDALALDAAYLSGRPLLLKGEPGTGKSLFALAAAEALGRAFESKTIDRRTDPRDLLWTQDPVGRLADAQLIGSMTPEDAREKRKELDIKFFVTPGPLWWGFNWKHALNHLQAFGKMGGRGEHDADRGVVVLIDEIDKADADVPNGLLESLGSGRFDVPGYEDNPVTATGSPLIIVTSNEERRLPAAFLRRCAVHQLTLPEDQSDLKALLIQRGQAHFPNAPVNLLEEAADMTAKDRATASQQGVFPRPGPAEFIDLLTAALAPAGRDGVSTSDRLDELRRFFLRKHVDPR